MPARPAPHVEDCGGEPRRFGKAHRKGAGDFALGLGGRHDQGATGAVDAVILEFVDERLERLGITRPDTRAEHRSVSPPCDFAGRLGR
jgi:hypothetical protein